MSYTFGPKSLSRFEGVHPDLKRVFVRAITITEQDFMLLEGVRTEAQQAINIAKGVSWTKASKHLVQPDGFGHAMDAVPVLHGMPRWEWPMIYPMAHAVRLAAIAEDVHLRWGAVWDKLLADLSDTPEGLAKDVAAYCERHPGVDRIDGPHFELVT